ncbi:MAG TPA: nitronate monooxygenase [Cytophagales bacterium]
MNPTPPPSLRTPFCHLLGIEHPVVQAGMGNVAGPELVAAVSNAGGLGILAATMVSPQEVRNNIRRVRQLTKKPFAVNLLLQQDLYPPREFAPEPATVQAVQATLNRFRSTLGIPESHQTPARLPPLIEQAFEVILGENVPVLSIGLGNPTRPMVARCHRQGMKVMAMVSTPEDALAVAQSGVDVLIAQGSEAGGHRSTWSKKASAEYASIGLMALLPAMLAQVTLPVLAAGGIVDGKGLYAALSLGAQGAVMGTRFVATEESLAPTFYKQKLLESSSDQTTLTDAFTGMYARVLRNAFTETYRETNTPVLPPGRQYIVTSDIVTAAAQGQHEGYYPLYAGQGVDLIRQILPAAAVVEQLMQEAVAAREALK